MILRAAGHGGMVNPLNYGDERHRMPAWMWGAIGVSVAIHVAGGVWLYNQRFEMPVIDQSPRTIDIIRYEPTPRPPAPITPDARKPVTVKPHTPLLTPPIDTPLLIVPPIDLVDTAPGLPPVLVGPAKPVEASVGSDAGGGLTAGPPVISNPQWLRLPTAGQMERAYPAAALRDEVTGRATIRCGVTVAGTLKNCVTTGQDPAGYGFGPAAVRLSQHFRMKPATVDGKAVEGVVSIPITFNLE